MPMTTDSRNPDLIPFLLQEARQTGVLLAAALDQNNRLIAMLQTPVKMAFKGHLNTLSSPLDPATRHRRNHRPGTLSRITSDPEIEAFIRAGLDSQTLVAIVAEIAATFPPERRISLSSLSRWWIKNGKAPGGSIGKS